MEDTSIDQTSPEKNLTTTNNETSITGTSDFSQDELYVNALQNEILNQGKTIEQFIVSHEGNHKNSQSFQVLEVLFDLFKRELEMNLNLRRTVLKEKESSKERLAIIDKLQKEKNHFFIQISEGSAKKITDFSQVISFVIDQMRLIETSLKHKKKSRNLIQTIGKLEKENKTLSSHSKKLEIENHALREKIKELQTSVQSSANYGVENQKLKSQLLEIQHKFEDQQAQNSLEFAELNSRADIAEQKFETISRENNQLYDQKQKVDMLINQQVMNINQLQSKLTAKKVKIEELKGEIAKYKMSHNNDTQQLQEKLSMAEDKVSLLQQKTEQQKKELEQYQTEILNFQTTINEAKLKMKRVNLLEDKINNLKQKNKTLKDSAKKNESAVSLLQECKNAYFSVKNKAKEYRSQIETLQTQLKDQKSKQENAISRITELRDKVQKLEAANQKIIDNMQFKSNDQSRVVGVKLQQLESKFNSIQKEYSSVSGENKRLYTQLQQSSFDMQRLEAENARLSTTIDRLQRDFNDTKSTAWFSSENANDSSYSANRVTRGSRMNKSKTYYIDDEDIPTTTNESDILPPGATMPTISNRFGKGNGLLIQNSEHNPALQEEINSLQTEIESLKKEMGRTE